MKNIGGRLIAYLFVGSFCIVGPLFVLIALDTALHRASLIFFGERVQGTVIAERMTGSSRVTYAPVVQFSALDAHTYTLASDVSGSQSNFPIGSHVSVRYRKSDPASARIDTFGQLWTFPLVFGVVGAAFSTIPAFVVAQWLRRRKGAAQETQAMPADTTIDGVSRGFRHALGVLLATAGLALLVFGQATPANHFAAPHGSGVFVACFGLLLTSAGVLTGQWLPPDSRITHALGGVAIISFAIMFGWVALYGDAAGFSGGGSIGHIAVESSGSVAPARIAFGIGSIFFGLASLPAWAQTLRSAKRPTI